MIKELLKYEEGFRSEPYLCSEGFPTVGYGMRLGDKDDSLVHYKFSLPEPVAMTWLMESVNDNHDALSLMEDWYRDLNQARQAIILSMAHQMGLTGLMQFKKMIAALRSGNYKLAGVEAMRSKWAKQTPNRANRHAEVLRTGNMAATYRHLIKR